MRRNEAEDPESDRDDPPTISIPFKPTLPPRKGLTHAPPTNHGMNDVTRSALLTAIAKSREWVSAIEKDPAVDFATIAKQQDLAERHVRFLAPLAYLSPRIIEAIADGRAPADLTVTRLVRDLPVLWAQQERQLRLV